jgi:hypothetical protein
MHEAESRQGNADSDFLRRFRAQSTFLASLERRRHETRNRKVRGPRRLQAVSELTDAIKTTDAPIRALTLVGTLARPGALFGGLAAAPCRSTCEANLLHGFSVWTVGVVALRTCEYHQAEPQHPMNSPDRAHARSVPSRDDPGKREYSTPKNRRCARSMQAPPARPLARGARPARSRSVTVDPRDGGHCSHPKVNLA